MELVETVTVTSKGQITIPSRLRKELNIVKGEKLLVMREGDSIKLVKIPKLSQMAGIDRELFAGRKPSKEIERLRREWDREFEKRIR
ncbi:AbrB family transcriptional regulator [Candidatus Bathyarchaeota archaeon]|nr:MAG: AbrB family transcriptional regulator [Candidatus Bathyarchaeota archaeon]